jgi:hypothetical protein
MTEPEPDLTQQQIDLYLGRDGWWNPDAGVVEPPGGWELLGRGDAFLTRRVKAGGIYWLAWAPKTRSRPHRTAIGLLAPKETIDAARLAAADTLADRLKKREAGARSRAKQEVRYEKDLKHAVSDFLGFSPAHRELAEAISVAAATRAAVVGSGRVGRTRLLSLEKRAELAARAEIRHSHTDYDQQLEGIFPGDDASYRAIKSASHLDVDAFLADHRA